MALSALSPVLPEIEKHFSSSSGGEFWSKAILTVAGLAMLIAPFSGWIARRVGGPRRLMLVCYGTSLSVGIAGAYAPDLASLILSRFVVGIAGALLVTLAISLIGDRYEGRARNTRIGINLATGGALIAIVVPVAGLLSDAFGWRAAFGVHLLAVPFLVALLAAPNLATFRHNPTNTTVAIRGPVGPMLLCVTLALLCGAIALSIPIYMPFRAREIGVTGASITGLLFAIMASVSVLSSLCFGLVRAKLSVSLVLFVALSLWATGMVIVALGRTLPVLMLGAFVIGIGGGQTQPSIFSMVATISPSASLTRNNGLIKSFFYIGPFIATSLLGLLWDHDAARPRLLTLGGLSAAMAVCALIAATGLVERRQEKPCAQTN